MSPLEAAGVIFKAAEVIGPDIVKGIAAVFSDTRPDLLPDTLREGRAKEIAGGDDNVIRQHFPKAKESER